MKHLIEFCYPPTIQNFVPIPPQFRAPIHFSPQFPIHEQEKSPPLNAPSWFDYYLSPLVLFSLFRPIFRYVFGPRKMQKKGSHPCIYISYSVFLARKPYHFRGFILKIWEFFDNVGSTYSYGYGNIFFIFILQVNFLA